MEISLFHILILSSIIFTLGLYGVMSANKNLIGILMAVELMLIAVNINFVAFSALLHDILGQIFVIFILTIAAAEAAIGLSILVAYYRHSKTIKTCEINQLHE